MKKAINFCCAFFLALGTMISFSPRDIRTRPDIQVNSNSGIVKHFYAVWALLGRAIKSDEK